MNLRELAAADHRLLVEDALGGFGRELTFVDPKGREVVVNGFWNDIGQKLDLETGALVAGTVAFVRVTLGALREKGLGIPEVVAGGEGRTPWLVFYNDMSGRKHSFKVNDVRTDRSIDAVDCYLEVYRA